MRRPSLTASAAPRLAPLTASAAPRLALAPLALAALLLARPAAAISIEDHLGRGVRTELPLTDMNGRSVRLSNLVRGDKPVVLVLAYYRCPALCNTVLRGLARGLGTLPWTPGEEYRVVTVSFDPRDKPEAAAQKRASALTALGRDIGPDAWPFLVAGEAEGRALAGDLGFTYTYDPRSDQYAHPAVLFVLTPDGRISRALDGVDPSPRDLRLALIEAGEGRIGTLLDKVLTTCYRYDPASRRYGPAVAGLLRLGGGAVIVAMAALFAIVWRAERRRAKP
jgi:protein SCO1/2